MGHDKKTAKLKWWLKVMKAWGTNIQFLLFSVLFLDCGSSIDLALTAGERSSKVSGDECWVPLPENVPNVELFAMAKRLVKEDQHAPTVAEKNEGLLLGTMWGSVPNSMKSSVEDFMPRLLQILSHEIAKTRSEELEYQRQTTVREFYEAYTDSYLSTYDKLYRAEVSKEKCRPLRLDEEKRVISISRKVALQVANTAAQLERNVLSKFPSDCYKGLNTVASGRLKTIQNLALEAAQIGAQKRGNPLNKQCREFAEHLDRAVEAKYERARRKMVAILSERAKRLKRHATVERAFIESSAHLYAMTKVITEAQAREIDIYRSPIHPTLAYALTVISKIRAQRYPEESKESLYLKRALEYHLEIEELLTKQQIVGHKIDLVTPEKLKKLEYYLSVLDEKSVRNDTENSWKNEFSPVDNKSVADSFNENPTLDSFICYGLSNDLHKFLSEIEKKYQEDLSNQTTEDVATCRPTPIIDFVLRDNFLSLQNLNNFLRLQELNKFNNQLNILGASSLLQVKNDKCPEGLPVLSGLPRWTSQFVLPDHLTESLQNGTVRDGYNLLQKALDRARLEARTYQFGRRGLALVTQLEKIEDNGRYFPGMERWNISAIPSTEKWGSWDRFFKKRTGRYRFFILLLTTSDDFNHSGSSIDWKQAMKVTNGCTGMPSDDLLDEPFEGLKVAVVVYEYYRVDEHSEPFFVERRLPAKRHIIGARMWMENELDEPLDLRGLVASRPRSE